MIGLSTTIRNDRAQVILDAIDAGAGAGEIRIYSGTQPATGDALGGTNVLLGTIVLSDPAGTIANGVLTFSPMSDDTSADADGTITWVRIVDSDGNFCVDMDAGISGSGATVVFTSVTVVTGGIIRMLSGSFTEGGA